MLSESAGVNGVMVEQPLVGDSAGAVNPPSPSNPNPNRSVPVNDADSDWDSPAASWPISCASAGLIPDGDRDDVVASRLQAPMRARAAPIAATRGSVV